jgi:hypothetical protein
MTATIVRFWLISASAIARALQFFAALGGNQTRAKLPWPDYTQCFSLVQARTLTERERRAIALQASSGDIEGAITRYLLRRAPEEKAEAFMDAPTATDALDEVADPELARIVREAVWFCWENGRPNYSPTPERRRFMKEYIAGRIPTARLLDEAWSACQAADKDAMRSGLLQQFSEPDDSQQAPNLDRLSDEAIDTLYHRTLRKMAEDSRR